MCKQTNGKQQQQKQRANEAFSTKEHEVIVSLFSSSLFSDTYLITTTMTCTTSQAPFIPSSQQSKLRFIRLLQKSIKIKGRHLAPLLQGSIFKQDFESCKRNTAGFVCYSIPIDMAPDASSVRFSFKCSPNKCVLRCYVKYK